MFGSNSWKQLPKWAYLLGYHSNTHFKILTNHSKIPNGLGRIHPWEKYDEIVEILRKTNLEVDEIPKYVTLAKKFKKKGQVQDLDEFLISKIPYWHTLYEHQKQAVAYGILDFKGRVYLADEMGAGKSFSAITIANYIMLQRPDVCKILFLCPASLKKNWKNIVNEKLLSVPSLQICIFSYDTAKNRNKELKAMKFDMYIADEAHCLKDPKSLRYKKLAPILKKIEFRILLSGTPTVNRANELFSPLSLLYPKLFKRYRKYNDRYFNLIARKCRLPAELALLLPLFGFIRRLKTDVLNLPPKKITFHNVDVQGAKKDLSVMMKKMTKEENMSNPNFLKYLIGEAFHNLGTIKSKDKKLKKIIAQLLSERGDKTREKVVFCFHKAMVECLKEMCNELNFSFTSITGETPSNKRGKIVEDFQNGKYNVIICSINAAGVGITLTKSNHVIMVENSWVPGLNQQAVDRVHRIGQKKITYVDRIHCLHSIDDFILKCETGKSKMHKILLKEAKKI